MTPATSTYCFIAGNDDGFVLKHHPEKRNQYQSAQSVKISVLKSGITHAINIPV
jgi:hypothetical protein